MRLWLAFSYWQVGFVAGSLAWPDAHTHPNVGTRGSTVNEQGNPGDFGERGGHLEGEGRPLELDFQWSRSLLFFLGVHRVISKGLDVVLEYW